MELTQRRYMAGRVSGFGTTVFSEISALAHRHKAVNLGQGFPDFDAPEALKDAAKRAIDEGKNQYAVGTGLPALRRAIADHAMRFYGQEADPEDGITVTSGATEAIFCAALALIDPGDEVIVFEPCYDSYVPAITMAGGRAVPVTLHAPGFSFDPDELARAFSAKTRLIFINSPHNPSGRVFSRAELARIAELCVEHDVVAVSDEVYEHLVYEGAEHLRLAQYPGMSERTVTISSLGKTFSATGWKIGWAIAPPELGMALRRVHQFSVFATSTPMQHAAVEALGFERSFFDEMKEFFTGRRDFLFSVLDGLGFQPVKPEGSYFILCDLRARTSQTAADYNRFLIETAGVAAIPLDTLYLRPERGNFLLRFCFSKRWDTLHAAAERLKNL